MQPEARQENILEKICNTTRTEVARRKSQTTLEDLKAQIKQAEAPRGFLSALKAKAAENKPGLIAEVKKASPSKGLIRADFDPAQIAKAYERAGAACISVLTDAPYFQGHDDYLKQVKETCALPVLRKDFMVDPYQIYESRALGADCILIIMAALSDDEANELHTIAQNLGMDALIEVHDEPELNRALKLKPGMIGINNRNLKTLEVDIQTSYQLTKTIPQDCLKIAESGIDGPQTLSDLQKNGFDAFLVGESLMRQDNIETATRKLIGNA